MSLEPSAADSPMEVQTRPPRPARWLARRSTAALRMSSSDELTTTNHLPTMTSSLLGARKIEAKRGQPLSQGSQTWHSDVIVTTRNEAECIWRGRESRSAMRRTCPRRGTSSASGK